MWESELQKPILHKMRNPVVLRTRRMIDGSIIRVYLSDGRVFEVPWDTVLMTCEPRYEHFGGLTKKSKAMINNYWKSLLFKRIAPAAS